MGLRWPGLSREQVPPRDSDRLQPERCRRGAGGEALTGLAGVGRGTGLRSPRTKSRCRGCTGACTPPGPHGPGPRSLGSSASEPWSPGPHPSCRPHCGWSPPPAPRACAQPASNPDSWLLGQCRSLSHAAGSPLTGPRAVGQGLAQCRLTRNCLPTALSPADPQGALPPSSEAHARPGGPSSPALVLVVCPPRCPTGSQDWVSWDHPGAGPYPLPGSPRPAGPLRGLGSEPGRRLQLPPRGHTAPPVRPGLRRGRAATPRTPGAVRQPASQLGKPGRRELGTGVRVPSAEREQAARLGHGAAASAPTQNPG